MSKKISRRSICMRSMRNFRVYLREASLLNELGLKSRYTKGFLYERNSYSDKFASIVGNSSWKGEKVRKQFSKKKRFVNNCIYKESYGWRGVIENLYWSTIIDTNKVLIPVTKISDNSYEIIKGEKVKVIGYDSFSFYDFKQTFTIVKSDNFVITNN